MEALHRVLVGQTLTRRELKIAAVVVITWIWIDVVQFADWVLTKLNPPQTVQAICIQPSTAPALFSLPSTRSSHSHSGSHQ